MPKVNLHIVAILLVVWILISFNWNYGSETFVLFGFAENKEMEIRLEHPITVQKIYAVPGTKVKKGDLLLEVTGSHLELSANDLEYEVARLGSELIAWESQIRASIAGLEAQKYSKEHNIKSQIEQLEAERALNKSLVEGITSIAPANDETIIGPLEKKLDGLRKELLLSVGPIDNEIKRLKNQLAISNHPMKIEIQKLNNKKAFVDSEREQLQVLALEDGVVGTIYCKEGEQFPAYSTLMSFYQENPTRVKGYVIESLLLKVKEGDVLEVQSSHQEKSTCQGKVIGMGSRIIEIPMRLRKVPEFVSYGREVIVEIPEENTFLQNEKVLLRRSGEPSSIFNLDLSYFSSTDEFSGS